MSKAATFDLNTATALATAEAVRNGTVSALEVCNATIARIEQRDGAINAVVVRDFDRARAAAKALDAKGVKGDRRPLVGVAMTVKESNDLAGTLSTWGMEVFKDLPVREDGIAVQRLKAAGAIILGKTNVSVALADWQAVNPVYGRTKNPNDPARSPGGSSGGAAAAVAAGMVPLELGSDIGGSVRVPAHMCGVFGHKPTYGIIPLKGHGFPGTDGIEVPLAVLGPLARTTDDLTAALDVLVGPVQGVPMKLDLPPARHRALRDYRVLVLDNHPSVATSNAVRDALANLAQALERAGVKVARANQNVPDLAAAHKTYGAMLTQIVTRGVPGVKPIDAHAWMELLDEQMRVTRKWRDVFAEIDIVLTPPFGVPAFPHDDSDWTTRTLVINGETTRYPAQVTWPGVATLPGLPATAAPIAKTETGLPIGVQIMGNVHDDRTTLAFAALLEREGLASAPIV